jgi:hypothetical protein
MGRLRFVQWLYRTGRLTTREDDSGYAASVSFLRAA